MPCELLKKKWEGVIYSDSMGGNSWPPGTAESHQGAIRQIQYCLGGIQEQAFDLLVYGMAALQCVEKYLTGPAEETKAAEVLILGVSTLRMVPGQGLPKEKGVGVICPIAMARQLISGLEEGRNEERE